MTTIKKNFAYNAAYQILIIILPIITAPYVSRVLGPSKMGQYSYTYSIATYFLLAAKLGFDNYGNRSIARSRDNVNTMNKEFTGIYFLQMIIAVVSITLYLGYSFFISNNMILSLVQGLWVLGALFDINWFFYGLEDFSIVVLRNTIVKVASIVLIFTMVKTQEDLWKYALILSAGSVIGFLITWPFILGKVHFVKVSLKEVLGHLKGTAILFIPVIAISVFTVLDKIMLGFFSTFAQVGYFESADKVLMAPKGIIGALGTVMLPRMANVYSNKDENHKDMFIDTSINFGLIFSIGCMFGVIGIANTFVPIFFGSNYRPTILILSLMALVLPFYAIGNIVRTQILIPSMRDKPYIYSVILGAVVNVIINLIFIPKFGANGAVYATFAAEAVIAIVQLLAVKEEIKMSKYVTTCKISIFSSIIMLLAIFCVNKLLGDSIISLFIQIVIGVAVFGITLFSVVFFTKNTVLKKLIWSLFNK